MRNVFIVWAMRLFLCVSRCGPVIPPTPVPIPAVGFCMQLLPVKTSLVCDKVRPLDTRTHTHMHNIHIHTHTHVFFTWLGGT